jgi:HSP20 family protein
MDRWQPLRSLTDIQAEMNRMLDNVFGQPVAVGERMWAPRCDLRETKDDIVATFEVPGVSDKDVHVSVTGDLLTVKGERRWEADRQDDSYHRVERVYGKFERTLELPMPVQADKVTAAYRDGVLTVTLPKSDELKPREIKVDVL